MELEMEISSVALISGINNVKDAKPWKKSNDIKKFARYTPAR